MTYLFGILLEFLSKIIIGIANVLDGKLSRQTFTSTQSIVVINGLLIIPILPILYLILKPKFLPIEQFYILIVVAAIEAFYQIPYYKALRETDTSVVMALFNIEKIFIPILAYFIIGERLSLMQYCGFGIIIFCSLLTTFSKKSFKINKSIYYMIFVCLILSAESILQKYSLAHIDWKGLYWWILALSVPFYFIILLFSPVAKREVINFVKTPLEKRYFPLYGQNIATWIAGGLSMLALSILPVTITKAIGSFHAVIVHLIANKGHAGLRLDKKESFSFQRVFLFIFIGIGVLMVIL